MIEIRDCKKRKVGMLDERTGFLRSRFGSDGYEGQIPMGGTVTITHGDTKTLVHRVYESEYEVNSETIA